MTAKRLLLLFLRLIILSVPIITVKGQDDFTIAEATIESFRREQGGVTRRSFMHGIPVLLKDPIDTNDKMNTTAGSYALLGSVAGRNAGVVEKLRKAGAVILGKASLT
ncbi:hypothetical protein V6N13_115166 [Hibiscus sabdariffa]|uniref:Uncharacterized protein n=2 Tax=Hibiscus sabdariffa TaxID=183260 RepID=A0ABR2CRF4_9ROSI